MRIKYYVMAIAVLFIIAAVYILSSNKEDVNDYPMPTEAKGAYYFSFALDATLLILGSVVG